MPKPSVPFRMDLDNPWKVTRNRSGTTVTCSFLVDWADALAFQDQACGDYSTSPVNLADPWSYGPWRCPIKGWLICSDVQLSPLQPKEGTLPDPALTGDYGMRAGEFFGLCRADVTWAPPDMVEDQALDDPENNMQFDPADPLLYCKLKTETTTEWIDYKAGTLVWEDDTSKKVPIPVKRKVTVTNMVVEFPSVRILPYRKIRPYIDCVNSVKFLGEDAGKLLFHGFADDWEFRSNGISHGATLKFGAKTIFWNQVIDPETGQARYPVKPGTLDRKFESKDFWKMFRP